MTQRGGGRSTRSHRGRAPTVPANAFYEQMARSARLAVLYPTQRSDVCSIDEPEVRKVCCAATTLLRRARASRRPNDSRRRRPMPDPCRGIAELEHCKPSASRQSPYRRACCARFAQPRKQTVRWMDTDQKSLVRRVRPRFDSRQDPFGRRAAGARVTSRRLARVRGYERRSRTSVTTTSAVHAVVFAAQAGSWWGHAAFPRCIRLTRMRGLVRPCR